MKNENPMKFFPGQLLIKGKARHSLSATDIRSAVSNHTSGIWGSVDDQQRRLNELALEGDDKLVSVFYSSRKEKFYVITSWDRSTTTIVLPEDYNYQGPSFTGGAHFLI